MYASARRTAEAYTMTIILALVLLALLAVAAFALALLWLVKSKYRTRRVPYQVVLEVTPESEAKQGVCARCQERRLIVSTGDRLCAQCYSALRTKRLE
jgi:hypothetical protein